MAQGRIRSTAALLSFPFLSPVAANSLLSVSDARNVGVVGARCHLGLSPRRTPREQCDEVPLGQKCTNEVLVSLVPQLFSSSIRLPMSQGHNHQLLELAPSLPSLPSLLLFLSSHVSVAPCTTKFALLTFLWLSNATTLHLLHKAVSCPPATQASSKSSATQNSGLRGSPAVKQQDCFPHVSGLNACVVFSFCACHPALAVARANLSLFNLSFVLAFLRSFFRSLFYLHPYTASLSFCVS